MAMNKSYRSNLSRARGIGPSKSGAKSWVAMRVSSLALIPVCGWFIYSCIHLATAGIGRDVVIVWLKMPINAFMMVMLIALTAFHGFLGNKEIIEDYIKGDGAKHILLALKKIGYLFLAAASIFAVLSIYFKG